MARTYKELRNAVLAYMQIDASQEGDLRRQGTDLVLLAANNAVRTGLKRHDFNFSRASVQVAVDPTLGVDWTNPQPITSSWAGDTNATIRGGVNQLYLAATGIQATNPNLSEVVVAGGTFAGTYNVLYVDTDSVVLDSTLGDQYGTTQTGATVTGTNSVSYAQMRKLEGVYRVLNDGIKPIYWTTMRNASQQVLRQQDRYGYVPQDQLDYEVGQPEEAEFSGIVDGKTLSLTPTPTASVTVEIKGYSWLDDLIGPNDTNFMLEYGFDWLMWQCILELNYLTKQYVIRQEGNLPPPVQPANRAWEDLIEWDNHLYADQMHVIE